jgi:3-oxoacyl-[acyl-carrier protein] reductase
MAESNRKKRLAGKVAIVTGAGRGIGRAEAIVLAREGARVVVNDLGANARGEGGKPEVAQRVVDEILAAGGEAIANGDSVATMEGAAHIVAAAVESFGGLDILVNNAGIARPGLIWELAEADWDAIMAVHLRGCYTMVRNAAPIFREQRAGVIVNTGSESGLGHATLSAYSAAKEGVVGFTRSVARDLGRYNVRCNAIRPRADTRMATPQAREAMQRMQDAMGAPVVGDRWFDSSAENNPEEVGVLVAWLCTDAAANVNGRTFQVGGGEVGLYSEPEVVRSVFKADRWTLDMLDDTATRTYLIGDLRNRFGPRK